MATTRNPSKSKTRKQPAQQPAQQQPWLLERMDAIRDWFDNLFEPDLSAPTDPTDPTGHGGFQPNPMEMYDLFTGGPLANTFYPGASLDRVIFPPGPIRPAPQDQALGLLAALLANQYNRRTPQQRGAGTNLPRTPGTVPGSQPQPSPQVSRGFDFPRY